MSYSSNHVEVITDGGRRRYWSYDEKLRMVEESFVKTFKRDYVRINPLPDAQSVLTAIHGWFKDYNENHPHSGLGWRSPKDFIQAQLSTC